MADRSISRASRLVVSALALGMIGLVADPALADVIALRGGGKVRGKVVPNAREGADRVTVLPEKGRTPLVFHKEQVVGVTAEPGPLDEYLVRRDRASSTAESQYELGLWCEGHKLRDLARLHYEAAVGHDKSFAPAHRKLGHVLHEDRWLTADELREAQGLVRYKGRWISQNEKEEREAREASVAEQASWARRIRLLRQAIVAGPEDRVLEARQQLMDIREPAAIAPLVRVLGEEGAPLRTLLDRILGEIPEDEAAAALVGRILREADPDVRPVTMEELQRRTGPIVVTGLVRALGSDRPEVVNRAAWALAHLDAVAAVPKLIPALVTVRYKVVWMPTGPSRSDGLGVSFGSVPAAPGVGAADRGDRQLDRRADRPGGRPRRGRLRRDLRPLPRVRDHRRRDRRRRLGIARADPDEGPRLLPERRGPLGPGQADRPRLRVRSCRLAELAEHVVPARPRTRPPRPAALTPRLAVVAAESDARDEPRSSNPRRKTGLGSSSSAAGSAGWRPRRRCAARRSG